MPVTLGWTIFIRDRTESKMAISRLPPPEDRDNFPDVDRKGLDIHPEQGQEERLRAYP
jgi:hypothetical protein